ncbi:hypothetical protein SLA2020_125620 [Shorea laevis]
MRGKRLINGPRTVEKASGLALEWRRNWKRRGEVKQINSSTLKAWECPEQGYAICDGSIKLPDLRGGFGVVVRNNDGLLICGDNGIAYASSAIMIEAAALLKGMQLAFKMNYRLAMFEFDSKDWLDFIQDDTRVHWSAASIAKELKII